MEIGKHLLTSNLLAMVRYSTKEAKKKKTHEAAAIFAISKITQLMD